MIQKNQIYLRIPKFLDIKEVEKMSTEYTFILQALFIHKSLRKKDIMETLLMSDEEVSIGLSLLYENNLIVKSYDEFSINPVIYDQLLRFLKVKKIL